jgi:hypothetical protein
VPPKEGGGTDCPRRGVAYILREGSSPEAVAALQRLEAKRRGALKHGRLLPLRWVIIY